MKTKQTTTFKLAKNMIPVGLMLTIQQQNGVEAAQVDTQAHIQELASLVSSALAQSGSEASLENGLSTLSTEEINAQIHSTIEEAIKSQESAKSENKANSKLGFLQKVVTLDCFFGGSDCLFKDKKSMMSGQVTEFAKKKFEAGNQDVNQYLAQVKKQVNQDLQANVALKSLENASQAPPLANTNIQTTSEYYGKEQEQALNKQLHESVQGLLKLNQQSEPDSVQEPASKVFSKVDTGAGQSPQLVKVPIDEKEAIGLRVTPTYNLDDVMSVTLKAFRKVIGYDTFDSIRRGNRSETKDTNDYYNVTVSMLIKRRPEEAPRTYEGDIFAEGKTLSKILDKGFPYDDGDVDLTTRLPKAEKTVAQIVGKLNGENITKQNLKNLVTDKTEPVTAALLQIDSQKSDSDGLFKLMDANVTRGNLKNLVTDKPSPITVGLAQKSDADGLFKLMDANVTRGNLKNLVTDKPSPITVGLAQKSDADGLFKLMDANVTRGNLKNLVTDKPSPITVGLAQKSDADGLFKLMDANVTRGNLKNLVTDKPSPITVGLAQTGSKGFPVYVNPESTLYPNTEAQTNFGFVDIPVGLDEVNFVGTKSEFMPIDKQNNKPQNLAVVERNGNKLELAQTGSKFMPIDQNNNKPQNLAVVERNANKLELAQTSAIPVDSSVVQQTSPGDFTIVDQEAVDSTLVQTGKITQKSATGLN